MEQNMQVQDEAVDFQELLVRVEQDQDLMQELFAMFREEYPRQRLALQQAVDAMAMPQIQAAGHTLKGMCANLAMKPSAQAAARVEMAGKEQNATELPGALIALDEAIVVVMRILDRSQAGEPA